MRILSYVAEKLFSPISVFYNNPKTVQIYYKNKNNSGEFNNSKNNNMDFFSKMLTIWVFFQTSIKNM